MTPDPMQTDQPNAAERAEPVSESELQFIEETWPLWTDTRGGKFYFPKLIAEVRTLRAEVEARQDWISPEAFEKAKEPVFAEGMRAGCEDLMRETAKVHDELLAAESALASEREKVAEAQEQCMDAEALAGRLLEAIEALTDRRTDRSGKVIIGHGGVEHVEGQSCLACDAVAAIDHDGAIIGFRPNALDTTNEGAGTDARD